MKKKAYVYKAIDKFDIIDIIESIKDTRPNRGFDIAV